MDKTVNLLGVKVTGKSRAEVLEGLMSDLKGMGLKKMVIVWTPTTEQVVMANENETFCSILNRSTFNIPDSWGLVAAERWLSWREGRQPQLKQRMPGVEVAEELALRALQKGKKVFLLGAKESGTEVKAKWELGGSGFSKLIAVDGGAEVIERETGGERQRALTAIKGHGTDLLLVAYGAPWQERWVDQNRAELQRAGVKVVMVVGGAMDMWAGKRPRAPLFWRKIGLEWLWRLILEPGRWRRQLRLVKFVGMVMKDARS